MVAGPNAPYKLLKKGPLFRFEGTEAYLTGHFIYPLVEELALFDRPGGHRTLTLDFRAFEDTPAASEIQGE